jgi:hypothetical protein
MADFWRIDGERHDPQLTIPDSSLDTFMRKRGYGPQCRFILNFIDTEVTLTRRGVKAKQDELKRKKELEEKYQSPEMIDYLDALPTGDPEDFGIRPNGA